MDVDLEQIVEDYLDGLLSPPEANWLEHNLVRREVNAAWTEALVLRELLHTSGVDTLPEGLVERIEDALGPNMQKERRRTALLGRTRSVLAGMGWAFKGPSMAYTAAPGGTRESMAGVGTIRYSLGPLANRSTAVKARPVKKKPLWRRVLRRRK